MANTVIIYVEPSSFHCGPETQQNKINVKETG